MKADFSGYASKAGLKCADGLTILAHAFKDKDGQKVPLIWQHMHDDPDMVLGHAIVEDRPDGTYVYGFFNEGPKAQQAKRMLKHGDIDSMSVFARRLVKRGQEVVHGVLHEVSLVLAGANPGALIENVSVQHGDGLYTELDDEAIIYTGLQLEHSDDTDDEEGDDDMAETKEKRTWQDIYDTLDKDQEALLQHVLGASVLQQSDDTEEDDADEDDSVEDTDTDEADEDDSEGSDNEDQDADDDSDVQHDALNNQETEMTHTVFDKDLKHNALDGKGSVLSHSQIQTIFRDVKKYGTAKESFLAHAGEFGIDDIELLFPDAKAISNTPEFISRRMEWVADVLGSTKHAPFSRIKTLAADITPDEARARGYVKGSLKKEEVFGLLRRITTPTTVYKKQKLDRDDILDITEINVVVWLKAEMRLMLEEELARAILIGDGRDAMDPDKIKDPAGSNEGAGIRSIANDNSIYAHHVTLTSGTNVEARIDELIRARSNYRGSGTPVFYTTLSFLTDMLLHKDKVGRRVYSSVADLASALLASKIVTVEPMEGHQDIVGIYVNLADYTVGTDAGGQVSFFDDFDIDYNQEKYLLETRTSGALTKLKSAVVVRRPIGTIVTPQGPSFDSATNKLTIPTVTGVVYTNDIGDTLTGVVTITEDVTVTAAPAEGYDFPTGVTTTWPFSFNEAAE